MLLRTIMVVVSLAAAHSFAHSEDDATVLRLDRELWKSNALWCAIALPEPNQSSVYSVCPVGKSCFPGEGREPAETPACGDGDMTLFNSLLCFSGVTEGCAAVEASQNNVTGQWYRSPRLRTYPRLRPTNSFSPDMALGVQLWAALEPESRKTRIQWWLDWIGRNQRCAGLGCESKIPRLCPDDDVDGAEAEYGCTMRPGDLALLAALVDKFGLKVLDDNLKLNLDRWKSDAVAIAYTSALTNKPGYSQHLAAVHILILWRLGLQVPELDTAIGHLRSQQPKNAFFAWMAGTPKQEVARLILSKCPKKQLEVPAIDQHRDWIWQREDTSDAWQKNMVWDCRFMAAILENNKAPKN